MRTDCTQESGTCEVCRSACTTKPGWLMPGDAERLAEHLDLSLAELFATKLAVDWWEADDQFDHDVFVIAPALVGEEPGVEYPGKPGGTCVFFADDRCTIHAAKPFECHEYVCTDSYNGVMARKATVTAAWLDHQDQIVKLLGSEPMATYFHNPLGFW